MTFIDFVFHLEPRLTVLLRPVIFNRRFSRSTRSSRRARVSIVGSTIPHPSSSFLARARSDRENIAYAIHSDGKPIARIRTIKERIERALRGKQVWFFDSNTFPVYGVH